MTDLDPPDEAEGAANGLQALLATDAVDRVGALRKLAARFPDSVDIAAHLAGALYAEGEYEQAADVADRTLADAAGRAARDQGTDRPFWRAFEVAVFAAAMLERRHRVDELLAEGRRLDADDVRWRLSPDEFRRQTALAAPQPDDERLDELEELDGEHGDLAHDALIALLRVAPGMDEPRYRAGALDAVRDLASTVGAPRPDHLIFLDAGDAAWLAWRLSATSSVLLGHQGHLAWHWEQDYWPRRLRLFEWLLDLRDGAQLDDHLWACGDHRHPIVDHDAGATRVTIEAGGASSIDVVDDGDIEPRPSAPPLRYTVAELEALIRQADGQIRLRDGVAATIDQLVAVVAALRTGGPDAAVRMRRIGDQLAVAVPPAPTSSRLDATGRWVGTGPTIDG